MTKKGQKPVNTGGPSKWEQGLIQAQLQEENWKVCIALLIENKIDDAVNVNYLNSAIATGSRRLFDKVTRQDLFREVYIYGNPKNRSKEIPLFAEVCETCKWHLDNKEEIPDLLLAKLIKYKLLSIKADDIKRRQLTFKMAPYQSIAKRSKKDQRGRTLTKPPLEEYEDPDVRKSKSGKTLKSAGKKGAAKKTPDPPSAKQGTLLKKRSEENLDQKFIDDEPEDGPQHYIVLSGFYQTKLLILLSELDVHVNTVIRYGCSDYDRFLNMQPEKDESLPKDSRLIAAEEAAAAENIRIKTGTETFWKEIFPLLMNQPVGSPLFHTHVQDQWIQEPMPYLEKAEVQAAYCACLFDDIAHMLYGLVDCKRQYENYIKNMKILTVPEVGEVGKLSSAGISETSLHQTGSVVPDVPSVKTPLYVDTRFYNELMDPIPLESVTIPLVIHCLIEQIVATEEQIEPHSERVLPPTADGLHQEIANHLGESIQKLSLDQDCLSSVAEMLPKEKVPEKSKLEMLNYRDTITKKLHHLVPFYDLDPEEVEKKMIQEHSPQGWNLFPEVPDSEKKVLSARTQEFLHFCSKGSLPMSVVDKVLCQNVLECISLSSVNADGTIESSTQIPLIAWDYPYKFLEEKESVKPGIPNVSSGVKTDEINLNQIMEDNDDNQRSSAVKVMESVVSCRQRNLENWNHIEHFKPNILQQVLFESAYTLPFVEKYYHHRNNCIYILLHNPYNKGCWNKESWKIQLHSNVGFRNYMLHVAANIQDWIQEEEEKYEALLDSLYAEKVEKEKAAKAEAALAEQLAERISKDGKKTPNKKGPQAQSKSPTRQESIFPSNGDFIRLGSLKAQKREQELLKLEEEEKEKKKGQKALKRVEQSIEKETSASPAMSLKSNRPIKSAKEESCIDLGSSMDVPVEEDLPFTGYDMGNNIISLTVNKYTLFPSDGAQIRVETTEYLYGCQSVKCSIVKNGHVFNVHLLNPKDPKGKEVPELNAEINERADSAAFADEEEKAQNVTSDSDGCSAEENIETKTNSSEQEAESFFETNYSDFGSINAVLSDGITLSFSKFGPTGYHPSLLAEKKEIPKQETSPILPSPRETPSGRSKKTKSKRYDSTEAIKVSDEGKEFEQEIKIPPEESSQPTESPPPPPPVFPNLHLTCPDGLRIEYFLECFYGIEPVLPNEHRILVKQSYPFRNNGMQPCESTRNKHAYREQHRIIISDGTVIKKMKDGTFEVLYVDGTVAKLEFDSSDEGASDIMTGDKRSSVGEKITSKEKWTITHPSGQKFILTSDGKKVNLPRVLFSMKSDIKSGQAVLTRDDHVILLSETSGKTIVEHEDGTRITSYYEEMPPSLQRNDKEASGVPYKKMFIMVECPSFATLKFNSKTSENLTLLANGTLVNVFPDGYYSMLLAGETPGDRLCLDLDGSLSYVTKLVDYLSSDSEQTETTYTFKHNDKTICETIDPDGTLFRVDHKGQHTIVKSDPGKTPGSMNAEETSEIAEYKRHSPRIFVLHPDGSGGEILPDEKVRHYLNMGEQDPDCIIMKDTFQDQHGIFGITLLKPYKSFPDSWLRDYELDCIVPDNIRLQTSINPDKAKCNQVKCPDALEIRQFTQYPLVNKTEMNIIEKGLCEYIDYCFKRWNHMAELQVEDNRTEEEKAAAENLQENMKQFHLTNPFKPQLKINEAKELYQKGITNPQYIPVVEPKLKENQNIQNVEKIEKDYMEEEMAKKALRNQEIPKYFDSMFGKAFLETQQIQNLDEKLKIVSGFPVLKSDSGENVDSQTEPVVQPRYTPPLSRENYHDDYQTSRELRPVNPSPSHASGNASPNNLRPNNPTPNLQKAEPIQERPENPTAKDPDSACCSEIKNFSEKSDKSSPIPVIASVSTLSNRESYKSVHVDVNGQPRTSVVPTPPSLIGGRSRSIPNQKFQMIEEPVRRQSHNCLTAGSTLESQRRLQMMRGLNLHPEEINFGILCEGNSYLMSVNLINTGVDSCHFKIKQPPPATGLKVTYQPGAVAAGLKRNLNLELFAIAVGADEDVGVGAIRHNLCITTETDILYLPIQATILTRFEYERQKNEKQLDLNGTQAVLISTVSPGTQGIIRLKRKTSKGQLRQ